MRPHAAMALFLISLGCLFLLDNFGVLPSSAWNFVWPLMLIVLGLSLILGRRYTGEHAVAAPDALALEGATRANIHLKHGAGRLLLDGAAQTGDLLDGTFSSGLRKHVQRNGPRLDVELEAEPPDWTEWVWPWQWWSHGMLDWQMHLSPAVPLSLLLETGASDSRIDLSQLHVDALALKTGASATELLMPATGATEARIESGAASVKVRVPPRVAARIRGTMGLGALIVDSHRFPQHGDRYESDDFATAANRVDLMVQGGVGAVSVN